MIKFVKVKIFQGLFTSTLSTKNLVTSPKGMLVISDELT